MIDDKEFIVVKRIQCLHKTLLEMIYNWITLYKALYGLYGFITCSIWFMDKVNSLVFEDFSALFLPLLY